MDVGICHGKELVRIMGKKALVFEADRTGYSIDQIDCPMTVGELWRILEDYDDDTLIILSHDNRYTFGTLRSYRMSEWSEDEDGEWVEY